MGRLNISFLRSLKKALSPWLAVLLAAALAAPAANATPYVVTLTQHGNDVVATGAGSIDLSGLTYAGGGSAGGGAIAPSLGFLATAPLAVVPIDFYSGFGGPANFGGGGQTFAAAGTGDAAGIIADPSLLGIAELFVPSGYVTEAALSGSATYQGATFASLGLTPGVYVWTWGEGVGDQTFTLDVGSMVAVPEPAVLALFGCGLLLMGAFVGLRRRVG